MNRPVRQERVGIVLFNLGGPDNLSAVKPFLFNLFNDPAIIWIPQPFRWLLAKLISSRRAPVAAKIYRAMGGRSPIRAQTDEQGRALEVVLQKRGLNARCVTSMRYWHPFSYMAVSELKAMRPDRVVLLPLYPQYSTTTTRSSFDDWERTAQNFGFSVPTERVCCYPTEPHFIAAHASQIRQKVAAAGLTLDNSTRILFSAHGLPQKVIDGGDPYAAQVEATVKAIIRALDVPDIDARICYQSRVGPLKWIGPATEEEIRAAGADGKPIVIVPVAFVSEHSETLVELDIEYRDLARSVGVPAYVRVPALGVSDDFIHGLAEMVTSALAGSRGDDWRCPSGHVCGRRTHNQQKGGE